MSKENDPILRLQYCMVVVIVINAILHVATGYLPFTVFNGVTVIMLFVLDKFHMTPNRYTYHPTEGTMYPIMEFVELQKRHGWTYLDGTAYAANQTHADPYRALAISRVRQTVPRGATHILWVPLP